ncbi:MAG: class I SAM-dependent methyltransferase, partial [Rhodomicrobium sp.]
MPEDVFLEPCRFTAAAKHYLAGRPAYAKGLISWVVKDLRLGEKDAVMDLGCGPGTLAMLFAPFVGSVLAIDPCPEIGRAFHWMDRPDTLQRPDAMVEREGAVALFADSHPKHRDNA